MACKEPVRLLSLHTGGHVNGLCSWCRCCPNLNVLYRAFTAGALQRPVSLIPALFPHSVCGTAKRETEMMNTIVGFFCVGPTIPRFVSKKENPWILRMLKGGSCPPLPLGEGAVYQAWSVNTHTVLAGGLISQNKWKHLRGWIISVQGLKSSAAAVV